MSGPGTGLYDQLRLASAAFVTSTLGYYLPAAGAYTLVARGDPARTVLVLSNPGTVGILLALTGSQNPPSGLYLPVGVLPWVLRFSDVGTLVQSEWWAQAVSATGVVTTVEVRAQP